MASDIHDPTTASEEVRLWLASEVDSHAGHDHNANRHGTDISAFCVSLDKPLDWTAFAVWLTMLLNRHGGNILRVKGMLHIVGVSSPVIIHGVQHTIHPPTHLDAWPEGRPGTRLIFIAKGLTRDRVQESLVAFNSVAASREHSP
jgi:G3E family GTPase